MTDKERNAEIFLKNETRIVSNPFLWESVANSIYNQQIIKEEESIRTFLSRFNTPCEVKVTKNTTFNASRAYNELDNVSVLNFASSTNVGGGVVWGASAQEESLCRCSTLYYCLNTPRCLSNFYYPHKSLNNLYNDDVIFTPKVPIFLNEDFSEIPFDEQIKVNVITCAAPNLKSKRNNYNPSNSEEIVIPSEEELYNIFVKRIRRIFEVASFNYTDHLIVGAFGCGAFKNDPHIVASAYKEVMKDFMYSFKTVEFAVYCKGAETNYNIFNEEICG